MNDSMKIRKGRLSYFMYICMKILEFRKRENISGKTGASRFIRIQQQLLKVENKTQFSMTNSQKISATKASIQTFILSGNFKEKVYLKKSKFRTLQPRHFN